MTAITYLTATDQEILGDLGDRLRALRKARGLTQSEVARRAKLARSTISEAENGENPTLQTVIRLLRVYGSLSALDDFIPEPEVSPMARLRARKAKEGRDG